MKKQELSQIYARFYNSESKDFMFPAKHEKRRGTLLWDSSVQGTFVGSVRDTFGLSKSHLRNPLNK